MQKEDISERDLAITKALAKQAIDLLDNENGDGWSRKHKKELIYFIRGMCRPGWCPGNTVPDASSGQLSVAWWRDDWVLLYAQDGKWVTENGLDRPFDDDADNLPSDWCALPQPPLKAIHKLVEEMVKNGSLLQRRRIRNAGARN
jgi:hypothetical protein